MLLVIVLAIHGLMMAAGAVPTSGKLFQKWRWSTCSCNGCGATLDASSSP